MLADSKGRKLVVGMTVVAAFFCYLWLFCVLYFYKTLHFALIYVFPMFLWVGGGAYVAGSVITAIAADVVPSEESRSSCSMKYSIQSR
jgi:MFS family permease